MHQLLCPEFSCKRHKKVCETEKRRERERERQWGRERWQLQTERSLKEVGGWKGQNSLNRTKCKLICDAELGPFQEGPRPEEKKQECFAVEMGLNLDTFFGVRRQQQSKCLLCGTQPRNASSKQLPGSYFCNVIPRSGTNHRLQNQCMKKKKTHQSALHLFALQVLCALQTCRVKRWCLLLGSVGQKRAFFFFLSSWVHLKRTIQ